MPTMTLRARIRPFRRGLSALLGLLYLTVALGAARHAGEHDESGLEWLPERFHHHQFQIVAEDADADLALHELCVACQWSRIGQRLGGDAPRLAHAAPVLRIAADGPAPEAAGGAALLPDSRGPPSA